MTAGISYTKNATMQFTRSTGPSRLSVCRRLPNTRITPPLIPGQKRTVGNRGCGAPLATAQLRDCRHATELRASVAAAELQEVPTDIDEDLTPGASDEGGDLRAFLEWLLVNGKRRERAGAGGGPRSDVTVAGGAVNCIACRFTAADSDGIAAGVKGVGQDDSKMALYMGEHGERGVMSIRVSGVHLDSHAQ